MGWEFSAGEWMKSPRLYINVLFTVSLFTVYLAFLVEIWGGGIWNPSQNYKMLFLEPIILDIVPKLQ